MKTFVLSLLLVGTAVSTTSCSTGIVRNIIRSVAKPQKEIKGSGHLQAKTIDFAQTPFNALALPSTLDAEFCPTAGAMRIEVIASDNVQQYVRTEVKQGKLSIYWSDSVSINDEKAVVRIYAPSLAEFDLAGTADCTVAGAYETQSLTVKNSGTGDLKAEARIKAQKMELRNSGTGDCFFHELLLDTEANIKNSGTGDNEIVQLSVNRLTILNSGTGDDEIRTLKADNLSAVSSGTGDIKLSGNAKAVNLINSGTGDIDVCNLKTESLSTSNSGTGKILK